MTKEVVISLIGAVVSLVSAALVVYQSARTVRLKAEADAALEQLKSEGERRKRAFELASQEAGPIEDALSRAWSAIQQVKEEIRQLRAPSVRYDTDLARDAVRPAGTELTNGYKEWGVKVSPEAKVAWHEAKNCVAAVLAELVRAIEDSGPRSPLPRKAQRLLVRSHDRLRMEPIRA